MRIIPIAIALLMLAGCDKPPAPPAPPQKPAAAPQPSPKEVRDFVQRRTDCNHWAGEDGYDASRRAEINAAYAKLRCAALEADEVALKARYNGNDVVQKMLTRAPE